MRAVAACYGNQICDGGIISSDFLLRALADWYHEEGHCGDGWQLLDATIPIWVYTWGCCAHPNTKYNNYSYSCSHQHTNNAANFLGQSGNYGGTERLYL